VDSKLGKFLYFKFTLQVTVESQLHSINLSLHSASFVLLHFLQFHSSPKSQ